MLPTFEKCLYGDNDGPSNGAKNIYSNYNQMRAYVNCSPNQSKQIMHNQPFHRAIDETLKSPEKC